MTTSNKQSNDLLAEFYADAAKFDGRRLPRTEAQKRSLVKARAAHQRACAERRAKKQRITQRLEQEFADEEVIPDTPTPTAAPVAAPDAPARPSVMRRPSLRRTETSAKRRLFEDDEDLARDRQQVIEANAAAYSTCQALTAVSHNLVMLQQRVEHNEMAMRQLYHHMLAIQGALLKGSNGALEKPQ